MKIRSMKILLVAHPTVRVDSVYSRMELPLISSGIKVYTINTPFHQHRALHRKLGDVITDPLIRVRPVIVCDKLLVIGVKVQKLV
jgi:hypothetical protein